MTTPALPSFFKPSDPGLAYFKCIPGTGTVSFRPLDLSQDLPMLHEWVNQAYAARFWQMNGAMDMLRKTYEAMLIHPSAHPFIGLIDGHPCCQIDLYSVVADELSNYVETGPGDCGLHVLMCPPKQMQRGWSKLMLQHFIHYYFLFDAAERLYAEPDQCNHMANQLAITAGFQFIKTIELSSKTANLYCIDRVQYRRIFS